MRILFLTNNQDVTKPLYDWLCEKEGFQNVILWEAPLKAELFDVKLRDVEFLVSYNYRHIIKRDVIDLFPRRIVNLHISMLPWNRGASPNFWSFIDDTPKGISIHLVDEGVDTGEILFQRQMFFDEKEETFASSYDKLHIEIMKLFKENWDSVKAGMAPRRKQGSYHTQKETDKMIDRFSIDWNENVASAKERIYPGLQKMGG